MSNPLPTPPTILRAPMIPNCKSVNLCSNLNSQPAHQFKGPEKIYIHLHSPIVRIRADLPQSQSSKLSILPDYPAVLEAHRSNLTLAHDQHSHTKMGMEGWSGIAGDRKVYRQPVERRVDIIPIQARMSRGR
jgi:hypothetical protein